MPSTLKAEMDKRGIPQRELARMPDYSNATKQYRGERRVSATDCLHYRRLFGIDPAVLRPDLPWGDVPSSTPIGAEPEKV